MPLPLVPDNTPYLEPLLVVDATFQPRHPEQLKGGTAQFIGWRGLWQASWVITEGCGLDAYAGEWHMTVVPPSRLNFSWAPSGDLDIHRVMEGYGAPVGSR